MRRAAAVITFFAGVVAGEACARCPDSEITYHHLADVTYIPTFAAVRNDFEIREATLSNDGEDLVLELVFDGDPVTAIYANAGAWDYDSGTSG